MGKCTKVKPGRSELLNHNVKILRANDAIFFFYFFSWTVSITVLGLLLEIHLKPILMLLFFSSSSILQRKIPTQEMEMS